MKYTSKFHTFQMLFAALVVALCAGCAATRPISDTVLGAGGAYAGYELSGGSAIGTAAGAAGGVLVSEGANYLAKKESDKSYTSGYEKGKSDAVKQQYWLYVSMQHQRNQNGTSDFTPCNCRNNGLTG